MPLIEVRTCKNGYQLKIEGHKNEYMYFSPIGLVTGVMTHVGMGLNEQMTATQRDDFVEACQQCKDTKSNLRVLDLKNKQLADWQQRYNRVVYRLINERDHLLEITSAAHRIANGDGSLGEALKQLKHALRNTSQMKPLMLKDFNIKSDAIIDAQEGDTDGEE